MIYTLPIIWILLMIGSIFTLDRNLDTHHCKYDSISGNNYCMPKNACWISNYDKSVICYRVAKLAK